MPNPVFLIALVDIQFLVFMHIYGLRIVFISGKSSKPFKIAFTYKPEPPTNIT
jgi:hypothetical protein